MSSLIPCFLLPASGGRLTKVSRGFKVPHKVINFSSSVYENCTSLTQLTPSSENKLLLLFPKEVKKQRATGRTKDGATFPLSISVNVAQKPERTSIMDDGRVYTGVVWVFSNISGMITFLPDGTIQSINRNFSLMLFGYTQEELVGKVRRCTFEGLEAHKLNKGKKCMCDPKVDLWL